MTLKKKYLIDEAPIYRRVLMVGGRAAALSLFLFMGVLTFFVPIVTSEEREHD